MRVIAIAGYAVTWGVLMAWQAVGLVSSRDEWPTLSDLVRAAMQPLVGRWMLFGVWLWVGWHLFARGWGFPLRS